MTPALLILAQLTQPATPRRTQPTIYQIAPWCQESRCDTRTKLNARQAFRLCQTNQLRAPYFLLSIGTVEPPGWATSTEAQAGPCDARIEQ